MQYDATLTAVLIDNCYIFVLKTYSKGKEEEKKKKKKNTKKSRFRE